MGFVEDELKQLKEVIDGLDSRIKQLEKRTMGFAPSTEEIRMIIMGPPGAGIEHSTSFNSKLFDINIKLQERALRRQKLRTDSPAVTWYGFSVFLHMFFFLPFAFFVFL